MTNKEKAEKTYKDLQHRKEIREKKKESEFYESLWYRVQVCSRGRCKHKEKKYR
ncbi:hypothetical protein CPJCM30710_25400 [Clostridium polyendosporum]|uniref:Uncharacterized protein n=1 Tax=Clostridium polyendosporum TaxID=69208 RepID=A0A919S102_9CLOT|nr:hypothetical protein [Clostridium polyendosporum]GIM29874.1 hypothetical protein CPJCM30710_25400 [Clostridium polyendosporum]